MDGQGGAVGGVGAAGGADALGDVEDDAGEAVLVEVDLLAVGDLADGAAEVSSGWTIVEGGGLEGRRT